MNNTNDYELIEREVMPDGWRRSKYRRDDGSIFHVAIPSRVHMEGSHPIRRSYSERPEHEMALRLAARQ